MSLWLEVWIDVWKNWFIDCDYCLMSSEQCFSYVKDEEKQNKYIKKLYRNEGSER
jgi:hypothetical protein